MDLEKYQQAVNTLEDLFKFAFKLSKDTHGRRVDTRREEVASFIFTKICLHIYSILRLIPRSSYNKPDKDLEIWDNTSIAIIARALIEAYYTFYYLAVDEVDQNEIDWRFLLWDFHSANFRVEKLKLLGSTHPELPQLEKNVQDLKKAIEIHPNFNKLDKGIQKKILKGDAPASLSNIKIAEKAGINPNYHKATYDYLSSYIHTLPHSISQVSAIQDTDTVIDLIKPILDECIGYSCFAIRDFIKRFPDQQVYLVESIQKTISIWEYVLSNMGKNKANS